MPSQQHNKKILKSILAMMMNLNPKLISCTYLLLRQLLVGINLVSAAFLLDPEASFEPIDSQKMRQSARRWRSHRGMKEPHGTLRRQNRKTASSLSSGRGVSVLIMAVRLGGYCPLKM